MAAWLRNLVMLVVMGCWGAYILVSLIRRDSIEQFVWYLPGAVYFALNPSFRKAQQPDARRTKSKKGVGGGMSAVIGFSLWGLCALGVCKAIYDGYRIILRRVTNEYRED